jgi:gas vesicle structural protein
VSIQSSQGAAVERSQTSSLADVVETILEKGVVVDVFARVSLVGIELLRVDARVVIASVDTYLRFAEAANRIDMGAEEPKDLTGVVGEISEAGAQGKTKGALEGGVEKVRELVGGDSDRQSGKRSGSDRQSRQRERAPRRGKKEDKR